MTFLGLVENPLRQIYKNPPTNNHVPAPGGLTVTGSASIPTYRKQYKWILHAESLKTVLLMGVTPDCRNNGLIKSRSISGTAFNLEKPE